MADGGASSGATTPARVSSYQASELRLQDSSKVMIEACHKMMARVDRLIASFDSILSLENSGSTTIIDHGEQDAELCQSKTDSRPGQEYDASTIAKIQMESPIIPDSTEIIDREEIEGQDPQISVTEGSNQGRIPNPSNDVFPKLEGAGDPTISWGISIDSKHPKIFKESNAEFDVGASTQELVRDLKEHPKVIRDPLVVVESEELDILPDSIKIRVARYVVRSMELLDSPTTHQLFVELSVKETAYKVFGEMPLRGIKINRFSIQTGNTQSYMGDRLTVEAHHSCPYPTIFDPGGSLRLRAVEIGNGRVIDMASTDQFGNNLVMGALLSLHVFKDHLKSMPFDRGRDITTLSLWVNPEAICVVQTEKHIPAVTLNFDPGGEMAFMLLSCMSCASKETVCTCSWWIKIDASVARGSGLRIIWRSQLAKSAYATGAAIDNHRLLVKVLVFDPGIPKEKKNAISLSPQSLMCSLGIVMIELLNYIFLCWDAANCFLVGLPGES